MADNDAADPLGIDLDAVQSLAAFAAVCNQLRAGRSYGDLGKASRPRPLPPTTLSDLLNAKSTPTRETVIAFLTACGLLDEAQRPWLAAWERVATAHQPRPDGAVRVRDARPRMLGVHAAIQVEGAQGELPPYVPRDLDVDLRTAITAAAANGGLVLMVGGSSVGKTRALFEAVRAALAEWWLLHPTDIPAIGVHAAAPTPRTVLWLDELQRYLNHPAGLTLGVLHRLITAGAVVVATLWPDEYSRRTARPAGGQPDPHAEDREILRLAHVVRVPDQFTTAERRRGEALANTDRRLRIALDTTDAGFTQVLAAGPALIQRWETAEDCYGQAVITAALDARRVGAHHPVTRDYLNAAAPAYLTPTQQATAPPDWLEQALAYATTAVHGATGCLTPAPAGMGTIAGWTTADYLHQHARRTRRTTVLPNPVWQALIAHHPDDAGSLAANAINRGRPDDAITIYRNAVHRGNERAAFRLVDMLAGQGRIDELRERAAAGDENAAFRLVDVLVEQGHIDEALVMLCERPAAGGWDAALRLVNVLVERDHIDEALVVLRERAAAGDEDAAFQLFDMLVEQDRIDELRERAAGDKRAAFRLTTMLFEQGRIDEAVVVLREHAAAGDWDAASRLATMLFEQGRIDEALVVLREHAAAGGRDAARRLVDMLVEQDRIDELRERAAAGDEDAARRLDTMLFEQGRIDELRERAAGDKRAAFRLDTMLFEQGRIDEALVVLREHAAAGDRYAALLLAIMLVEQGRIDEALVVLREHAAAGDRAAALRLAEVLVKQGHIDEALVVLREHAAAGDRVAALLLVHVLFEQGRIDELRERATAGDEDAAFRLADVLAKQGRIDELRERATAGDERAAFRLAEVLVKQGHIDEALVVLREHAAAGGWDAARRLVTVLVEQGRIEDIRDEVAAGTLGAVAALRDALRACR